MSSLAKANPFVRYKNWTKSQAKSIWPTLLFVLVIHSSFLQAFKIPSGSMIPTLLIGDRIFVDKVSYALKIPFTDWFGHKPNYLFQTGKITRGDVVVFKYPVDPSIYFVKRVIGLPGETIEMKDKTIFVNGQKIERTEIASPDPSLHAYLQTYEHTSGTILINDQNKNSVNYGPVVVPPGQYFCMGDNRDNSLDSRFWGFVPFENIEGKAFVIWFSTTLNQLGTLLH